MTDKDLQELRYFIDDCKLDLSTTIRYIQEGIANDAERNPVGRPRKITNTDISYILELREDGYTQEQIAYKLELSISSIRRVLKNHAKTL